VAGLSRSPTPRYHRIERKSRRLGLYDLRRAIDVMVKVTKTILGWREWVRLPDLGVKVKAKLDTGALTSAIHAFDVVEYRDKGAAMVSFAVHPFQRRSEPEVEVIAEIADRRLVRSSAGHEQHRIVVLMDLSLAGQTWTTEVTLARRDQMGFRMLLGRRALRGRFLVDPRGSFRA